MPKTYFQYEGEIKSQELSEAIGIQSGFGPMFGFGSVETLSPTGDTITLCQEAPSDSARAISNFVKDKIISHRINGSLTPVHGLITKTGHIFLSDNSNPQATIYNSQSNYREILVFARFNPIPYPVENAPTLEAYWNESTTSFYDFYRNSNNPYVNGSPKITDDLTLADPASTQVYTFENLMTRVKTAVQTYNQNENSLVLIGIYGEANGKAFSIVPYGGIFPQPLNFNLGYHNYYIELLTSMLKFIGTGLTQYSSVKEYVDDRLSAIVAEDEDEPSFAVPIGGIIMWSGDNVPNHYRLCNGKNGTPNLTDQFIMAGELGSVGKTGGQKEVSLTANHIPSHQHNLPYETGKWGDDANNRTLYPQSANKSANLDGTYKTSAWGSTSPTPVPTLPPYYVLAFIMRYE